MLLVVRHRFGKPGCEMSETCQKRFPQSRPTSRVLIS